jgi:hypothetical protein
VGISQALTIAVVVPLVLRGLLSARGASAPGTLDYPRAYKVFALVVGLLPCTLILAIVAAGTGLKPSDRAPVAFILLFFLSITAPLVLEFFQVRHTYDDECLRFVSPWSRKKLLRWSDVSAIRWRSTLKWLDLEARDGKVFHISPMLRGLDGFGKAALARIPAQVLEAAPDGRAVLELMVLNTTAPLVMSPESPQTLLAQARPTGGASR